MPNNAFDPTRDHLISRPEAADLVLNFQSRSDAGAHFASAFNRSAFEKLLGQPGAAGIRIYLARHADGSPTMVLVAVNAEGVDMEASTCLFAQNSHDCPPDCAGSLLSKTS